MPVRIVTKLSIFKSVDPGWAVYHRTTTEDDRGITVSTSRRLTTISDREWRKVIAELNTQWRS